VVRGLHGYGKTTQVAAWLGDQVSEKITSVWVTARPTTDGFQGFEGCLSQSLRSAGAVPEPAPGGLSPSGLDELAAALLAESPDRKFVLVIDNFHNVRDGRVLAELVSLVERRRNFHLYLCCRGHHPIESLATGTTEVNVIEPKELMLGVDEIVELAQVIGAPVDRSGAQSLRDAIGGCVLMVRMALTATEDIEARTGVVEEYLRTSILSDLGDEALLRQLMRLSLSEPVSWRLFRDLCDEPDPRRLLDSLEITGLLERVNGGPEVLFTIPALLRGMLRDEYSSTSPDGARAFHRRLAEWFAGHSDGKHVPSAFHHAGAGRDWELMDRLWSEDVTMMIKENPGLVRETLEALPADVLATRPSMQVFRDILEIAAADTDADGHRATMRAFADACTRLVKQHWDTMPLGELLIVATGYMIGLRLLGRYQDAAAFGDCVNARTSVLSATKRAAKGRFAWFYLQRGITYSLICDNASAIRSYRQAWEHGTGAGVDFVQSQAAANLALTYALGGDTTRAQQWLSCHRGIDTRDWPGDNLISIGAHVAAGLLALDRLDIAQVRSELDHLAECSAPVELWPYVAYLYAQHALHSGNALGALAHLDELQAANDGEQANKGAAVVLMTRARADLLIACGRGEKAKRLIEAQGIARPMNRVPAARIRLLSRRDGPGGDLDPLTWDPATSVRDRVEMLLLGAVSALREGDTRNAERLVNQALDLHNETGVLRPFAAIAHSDLVRLLELADRDLEADEAADLARRAPVYPENLVLVELSRHEQAVLEALATTGSRQAIADSLFVSLNTVKTQLASIHQKLGTATREETLSKAREHELLPPEGTD
jgi:LuxR family maltose regulon positive regulatory protein